MPVRTLAWVPGQPTRPRLGLPLFSRCPSLRYCKALIQGALLFGIDTLECLGQRFVWLLGKEMLQSSGVELAPCDAKLPTPSLSLLEKWSWYRDSRLHAVSITRLYHPEIGCLKSVTQEFLRSLSGARAAGSSTSAVACLRRLRPPLRRSTWLSSPAEVGGDGWVMSRDVV